MMDCETLMDRHAIDATRVHVMTYLAKYSSVCNHDFGFFTEQTGIFLFYRLSQSHKNLVLRHLRSSCCNCVVVPELD